MPQHVVERAALEAVQAGKSEMLGDEDVEVVTLFQVSHFDEDRDDRVLLFAKPARQLTKQEGLAGSEIAEDQDETARVVACAPNQTFSSNAQHLVLVRHLRRTTSRFQAGASRGHNGHVRPQPVEPSVVCVSMEDEVQMRTEVTVEVVDVTKVLVVVDSAADRIVMDEPDTEPTIFAVRGKLVGKAAQLSFTNVSVVVLVAVALDHRRVETSQDDSELFNRVKRPRFFLGEADARDVAIEDGEHVRIGLPLPPVRRLRRRFETFAFLEIGLAERPADVVVAGDDGDPIAWQAEAALQTLKEDEGVLELLRTPPFGKVTGHRHDLGTQVMLVREQAEVVLEALTEGVEGLVGAEAVVASELDVGEMEDGNRTRGHDSSLKR